jgi:hypothetical protein
MSCSGIKSGGGGGGGGVQWKCVMWSRRVVRGREGKPDFVLIVFVFIIDVGECGYFNVFPDDGRIISVDVSENLGTSNTSLRTNHMQ